MDKNLCASDNDFLKSSDRSAPNLVFIINEKEIDHDEYSDQVPCWLNHKLPLSVQFSVCVYF